MVYFVVPSQKDEPDMISCNRSVAPYSKEMVAGNSYVDELHASADVHAISNYYIAMTLFTFSDEPHLSDSFYTFTT